MNNKVNEVEYLACEAEVTKMAIRDTLKDVGTDLGAAAKPSGWIRQFPWPSIGVAVVAGLMAARKLKKGRCEEALDERAASRRRSRRERRNDERREEREDKPRSPGIFASALSAAMGSLVGMLRPIIEEALRTAVSSKSASNNGQPAEQPIDTDTSSTIPQTGE